jgi:hypothetical protein
MMGHHARSEALFYYFRLEDQIPEKLDEEQPYVPRPADA